jgi:integrase
LLEKLNIPKCGLHAFRHMHSSLLLETGASPSVAQAQLRHSDARITLGVYGHVIGDSQRTAVEKVAKLLAPSGPKSEFSGELIQ